MDFLKFSEELWKKIGTAVLQGCKRIAENMSEYPDPSDLYLISYPANSALDVLVDIWALEYLLPGTRTRFQTYDQRERASRLVRSHRRQGNWKVVGELILQPQGTYFLETVLLRNFSPEDIFGNLVPRLLRRIASFRPVSKKKLEQRSQQRYVKAKVRRRGYSDHGTLRPSHRWMPDNAYAEPETPREPEVPFRPPRRFEWLPEKVTPRVLESDNASVKKMNLF